MTNKYFVTFYMLNKKRKAAACAKAAAPDLENAILKAMTGISRKVNGATWATITDENNDIVWQSKLL